MDKEKEHIPTKYTRILEEARSLEESGGFDELRRRQIMYHGGKDEMDRNILVFVAQRIPDVKARVMHLFLVWEFHEFLSQEYVLVYCHRNCRFFSPTMFSWLSSAYQSLTREYKKNLKLLLVIDATFWVKSFFSFIYPFLSNKFWRKLRYINSGSVESLSQFREFDLLQTLPRFVFSRPKPIFGRPIESASDLSSVPRILTICIDALEELSCASVEGIFRISGDAVLIKCIASEFDKGDYHIFTRDVHVIAGVLKKYFRELPDPLLSVDFLKLKADSSIEEYKDCVTQLSPLRRNVLQYLLRFLKYIADHAETNKMSSHNLAIVFSGSLLRSELPGDDLKSAIDNPEHRPGIMQKLIDFHEDIFQLIALSSTQASREASLISR